jgi:hypothetical protein
MGRDRTCQATFAPWGFPRTKESRHHRTKSGSCITWRQVNLSTVQPWTTSNVYRRQSRGVGLLPGVELPRVGLEHHPPFAVDDVGMNNLVLAEGDPDLRPDR